MELRTEKETYGQAVLKRFESYGFWIGLALGLIVGIVVVGPNFRMWSAETILWVTLGCIAGGGVIGYFSGYIATASLAKGPGWGGDDRRSAGATDGGGYGGGDGGNGSGD